MIIWLINYPSKISLNITSNCHKNTIILILAATEKLQYNVNNLHFIKKKKMKIDFIFVRKIMLMYTFIIRIISSSKFLVIRWRPLSFIKTRVKLFVITIPNIFAHFGVAKYLGKTANFVTKIVYSCNKMLIFGRKVTRTLTVGNEGVKLSWK